MKNNREGVLLSVRPEWAKLIARGVKTKEIRMSLPEFAVRNSRIDDPSFFMTSFPVWFYCTKNGERVSVSDERCPRSASDYMNGRVLGRATVYGIRTAKVSLSSIHDPELRRYVSDLLVDTCVSPEELAAYLFDKNAGEDARSTFYIWGFFDLQIYEPFRGLESLSKCGKPIRRAPVSWCYAEEVSQ